MTEYYPIWHFRKRKQVALQVYNDGKYKIRAQELEDNTVHSIQSQVFTSKKAADRFVQKLVKQYD